MLGTDSSFNILVHASPEWDVVRFKMSKICDEMVSYLECAFVAEDVTFLGRRYE